MASHNGLANRPLLNRVIAPLPTLGGNRTSECYGSSQKEGFSIRLGLTEKGGMIRSDHAPLNRSTRLEGQDLSNCGGGKESPLSERGKSGLGKLRQVLFQHGHDVGTPARLVIPRGVLNDPQVVVPK